MTYDPERWLESTMRTLKDYAEDNLNTRIYEVVMEFPGPIVDAYTVPLKKTLVHFELDDDAPRPVGFGDGMFATNYDEDTGTLYPQYALVHDLLLDVGIWASDSSGGTTSRMRAKQLLDLMFGMNEGGAKKFRDFSDAGDGGIEVRSFTGGRFVLDTTANDIRLYRMVDCALELRVFSRTPLPTEGVPGITDIQQDPGFTIIG